MRKSKQAGLTTEALHQAMPFLSATTTVWVAYSGGCDSHVLLHALSQLQQSQGFELKAVYVNHNLSPNAVEWGGHCQQVCVDLEIAFVGLDVDASPQSGESPEAAARNARYQAITETLQAGDYLCTAHHQDDQAETLLLQLLRGAGPKGLAGMPQASALGKATQLRPLLGFSQAQLQVYAEQYGLYWIEDESNSDTGFNRNYLRHEVMPLLRQRWPAVDATIARSANNCAEAAELIEVLAEQDYQLVKVKGSSELSISNLFDLDKSRLKNVLRYWIRLSNLPLPSDKKLQHIISDVLHAAEDKTPLVYWPGAEIRRFNGRLFVMSPLPEFDSSQVIHWQDLTQALALPDGRWLSCEDAGEKPAIDLEVFESGQVTIRFRQGGEVCQQAGSHQHKSLKQLFQEAVIAPWQRQRIPLVYVDEDLVAVVGVCISDDVSNKEGGCQLVIG